MKNLLRKEIVLSMHPTALIFLLFSAMLMIPNYPYYVIFFYTTLAVFFTCLNGRENNDVFFTLTLPVAKRDAVRSRFVFTVLLESVQMLFCVPFAFVRQAMPLPGNAVGMDANIAFFGLSFVLFGIFNFSFFTVYYRDINKIGRAFLLSSTWLFLFIIVAETCVHAVPFFRDRLDTPDPQFLPEKLLVLAAGLLVFALLTFAACRRSERSFEAQDL